MNLAKQSTAKTFLVGPILDADGAAVTGALTATDVIKVTKNGAVGAADAQDTLTHNHTGHYVFVSDGDDFDTLGEVEFSLNSGTNAMAPVKFQVVPETVYDALIAGTGTVPANATKIGGSATVAGNLADWLTNGYDLNLHAGRALTWFENCDSEGVLTPIVQLGVAGEHTAGLVVELANSDGPVHDSIYIGHWIVVKAHDYPRHIQARRIAAYDAGSVAGYPSVTVDSAWTAEVYYGDTYAIVPAAAVHLIADYDAAKTAAQAGDAMALTAAAQQSVSDAAHGRTEHAITAAGTLNPDITGAWTLYGKTYNGTRVWKMTGAAWYLWRAAGTWFVSTAPGTLGTQWWYYTGASPFTAAFTHGGSATGDALTFTAA